MKFYCRVVPYLLLVVMLAACSTVSAATRIQDGDPGTIGACLAQPDGTRATLFGEEVLWRGRSGKSFAVKEWFEARAGTPRLVVVSTSQLPVEEFWSVDVTGTLRTVAGRDGGTQRVLVVSPADVQIYCSSNGRPCPFIPVKTSGTEWPDKVSLIELAGSTASARTMASLADAGLPPMPDSPDSEPPPPAPGSRDSLKWLPDGAPVSVNGAVVSAGFSDYGFFYVERSDRSFGIWISAQDYVYDGQLLDITGRMGTGGGERVVIADQGGINYPDYNTYPRPLEIGMPNKMLGGGAVGSFTLPVSDAVGLNNTGLLVRACGKVTAVDAQNPIFWIDDGSAVTSDGGHTGIKVYDLTYDPLPSIDDYVTLSGVSAAEWPEGSDTSIRVIWKTASVTPSTQSGSGTISGTITATGAGGKTVRIYCGSGSTTATFSGNTANYSLGVPYGDHAVTATLLGYKTSTQLATASSGTPVDLDFALSTLERRIDIVSSPWRVPPDGTSQMTITVIVRDEEGRRFGNEAVTWSVDLGTVVSSDAMTDAVGEARLVLQAPSSPGTGTVSVTVGGLTRIGYAEFASPTAPSVRIVSPTQNDTLSGTTTIELESWDAGGANPGVVQLAITVDGQPLSATLPVESGIKWTTFALPNGVHIIRAAASDGDAEYGYSQAVTVTTSNGIYGVSVGNGMFDANDPDPAKRIATISAYQDQSTDWEVEITKRGASSPTRVFTGTGATISAAWDGTDSLGNPAPRGRYKYTIRAGESQGGMSAQSYGFTLWDYLVFLRTNPDAPTALLVEGAVFDTNDRLFDYVEDACETRGFQVITIPYNYATWDRYEFFMNVYEPTVLCVSSHGHYEIRNGIDCAPPRLPQVSQFLLKDSVVYAYRPQDNQSNYFPEYPEPGQPAYANIPATPGNQWPDMTAHYVSELGLMFYSPLKLVWMDICFGGRIGSDYGDLSDQFNPYAVVAANDLASEFGIYDNAWTIGASFCSYFEQSIADNRYADFVGRIFGSLKVGYNLDQAITRDAWNDGRFDRLYPGGITSTDGDCQNWRLPMPPYHNLRVHGNPWSTRLNP